MFKEVKKTWQTFVTRGREKVIFDTGRGEGGGPESYSIVRGHEQVI